MAGTPSPLGPTWRVLQWRPKGLHRTITLIFIYGPRGVKLVNFTVRSPRFFIFPAKNGDIFLRADVNYGDRMFRAFVSGGRAYSQTKGYGLLKLARGRITVQSPRQGYQRRPGSSPNSWAFDDRLVPPVGRLGTSSSSRARRHRPALRCPWPLATVGSAGVFPGLLDAGACWCQQL